MTLSVALLGLGFLIAAQLSAEGPRIRYTSQERAPLIETVLGLQSQQDALKARILDLRNQISVTDAQLPGSAAQEKALNADLERARIQAGLVQLTGSGLVFRLEDADAVGNPGSADGLVTARDVRIVIQELWLAGAEAVSVNGERIVGTSAVLDIGNSILVNSAYLAPPYEIRAIGPADLYSRITGAASFVEFVQDRVNLAGLRLSFAELETVTIPAYAGNVTVRYMRIVPAGS
ncbi:MAG: DUF881 domain-containing protein [Chloroflexi bacterium]|nr:DUF881 domain-containing protein [Chloroflexota bacterium]